MDGVSYGRPVYWIFCYSGYACFETMNAINIIYRIKGVGALMSFADIDIIGELVEFDGFTGGGYLMVMFGAVNLVMMFVFFTEPAKRKLDLKYSTKLTLVLTLTHTHIPTAAAKEIVYDVNSPEPERKSFVKRAFVYFTSWVGVGVLLYATLQLMSRNAIAVYETLSQLIAVNNFGWGIFVLGMVSCAFGIGKLPLTFNTT